MKAPGKALFKPSDDAAVDASPDEDVDIDVEEDEPEGGDELLGNAFDALQDGDREGFVRSLKAAISAR